MILRYPSLSALFLRYINIVKASKIIQDVLGHVDIGTMMNIYADAVKELK